MILEAAVSQSLWVREIKTVRPQAEPPKNVEPVVPQFQTPAPEQIWIIPPVPDQLETEHIYLPDEPEWDRPRIETPLPEDMAPAPVQFQDIVPEQEWNIPRVPDQLQTEDIYLPDEPEPHRPRIGKLCAFLLLETVAAMVLGASAALVLARGSIDPTVTAFLNVLAVLSAGAVALIPIFLFALSPTLTRRER